MRHNTEDLEIQLHSFQNCKLIKTEYFGDENTLNLSFSCEDDRQRVISLNNCIMFKDYGVFHLPVEQILIKPIGHLFREYCLVKQIDFENYEQIEIYPFNFKKQLQGSITYKTFFALCRGVSVFDSEKDDVL